MSWQVNGCLFFLSESQKIKCYNDDLILPKTASVIPKYVDAARKIAKLIYLSFIDTPHQSRT